MDHFDYIVIGAGIEGSWTAYQLIKDETKPSVLLIERFPLPHSRGSSHGQTRIIRHAYPESFHTALMPKAFQEWRQLEKDSGTHLLIPKPLLCVANESGYKGLDNTIAQLKAEQQRSKNDISFRELSNKDLAKEFPQATYPDTYRGCIEYSAGILLADRCLATVQKQFKKLGGVIRDGFVVSEVLPGDKVVVVGIHQGKDASVSGSKVAICPGPWAKKLLEPLIQQKLPVTTLRVPVFYWKIRAGGPGAIPAAYIDHSEGEFWGIPDVEYTDMIKLCSHSTVDEADPDERDKNFTHPNHLELTNYIRKNFPGVEDKPSVIETCMYTSTPDTISIIDIIPGHHNIAYACGFSGTGFKKGPCVGLMLKQLLSPQSEKVFDMSPFALSRFSK